ncbi:MAG: ATP-dependent sacrificial sulfur transferase LarE [Ruminococcus sp.]
MSFLESKRKRLERMMDEITGKDCCVAFSGGVDSSLILKTAVMAAGKKGSKVAAVTFDTALHPAADISFARETAGQMGADHYVITVNELEEPEILNNPVNRCYLCKRMLFGKLLEFASDHGFSVVLEGTNKDDEGQYRPGIQAVEELGIVSPLRQLGFSKTEVRALAAELGIAAADRPSAPCLATRLPYGTRIDADILEKIDRGENFVRKLGFRNVRLRLHGDIVRLEVDREDFPMLIEKAELICCQLKKTGFSYITMDLEGFRSGSMDENV